jgi:branched-chain amino acid transport system permease protein
MDATIALILAQDGLITGAIYALLSVALVLIFTVTRVIFVPQGEFVAFAALTMAALDAGSLPGTVWLLLVLSGLALLMEAWSALRQRSGGKVLRALLVYGALPAGLAAAAMWVSHHKMPFAVQALTAIALIVPLGPLLYRTVYQPIANASILVLLIVSVALHVALSGLGLQIFGAEGVRSPALSESRFTVGSLQVTGQSLWVLGASAAAIAALFWFFNGTFRGKALKATAVNRTGAELMGISPTAAGSLAFTLAAAIGALSGLLIGPVTTIFYDTGFIIGLKGFVAAIIGGLASYPLSAAGALLVGLLESYSSFWASAYKEVIVFTLILPVLLWRSLYSHHAGEDEE